MVILVALCMGAAEPEHQAFSLGERGADTFGIFQGVREGMFVLVLIDFLATIVVAGVKLEIGFLIVCLSTLAYSSCLVLRNIAAGVPSFVTVSGLRLLIILSFVAYGYLLAPKGRVAVLSVTRRVAMVYVTISLGLALWQTQHEAGYFGATIFGARAYGFSFNPIGFSQAMAALLLAITVASEKRALLWIGAASAAAVVSGGRSGMLGCLAVGMLLAMRRFRAIKGAVHLSFGCGGLSVRWGLFGRRKSQYLWAARSWNASF